MQLKSSLVNPHLIVIKRKNCRLKEIERTTMVIKASAITCIVSTFKWKTVDSELLKMRITFLSSSLFKSHPITLIFNFITATVSLNGPFFSRASKPKVQPDHVDCLKSPIFLNAQKNHTRVGVVSSCIATSYPRRKRSSNYFRRYWA